MKTFMENPKRIKIPFVALSLVCGFLVALLGFIEFYSTYTFHLFLSLAAIIICVGPTIYFELLNRRKNKIDENLPRLINDLAESQETGMTLIESLEESSRRKYGPLSTEIKKLLANLSWGIKLEDAFENFARRTQTEMTRKVITLVLQAINLGGDLKRVFGSTATFAQKMIELKKERSSQLRQYVFVIYTIMIIFQVLIVVLYQNFFMSVPGGSRFIVLKSSPEAFKGIVTDLSTIEAIVGGIIAGKLGEGSIYSGLKHVVILLIMSLLVSTFLL